MTQKVNLSPSKFQGSVRGVCFLLSVYLLIIKALTATPKRFGFSSVDDLYIRLVLEVLPSWEIT